jgi:hypothetical protein
MSVEKIMEIALCSREDAENALKKTGNDLEAVCLLMEAPKPKKERTTQQKFFDDIRESLADMEKKNVDFLNANRLAGLEQGEKQTLPEETSQQNNCSPECQPRAQESTEQKQETDGP